MRILTWNLFHGRAVPPASGPALYDAFAGLIASWAWDVALLQETPPWWPRRLAAAARAHERTALTSRNALLPLRRALAERWPELTRSNGGGANAILVRGQGIAAYGEQTLRRWPERRVAQLALLEGGVCVVNFHGSTRVPLAEQELARLWQIALDWAPGAPLVLGGDLNLRAPRAGSADAVHLAARDVDHLFARGLHPTAAAHTLARSVRVGGAEVELSDHPPLLVEATIGPAGERRGPDPAS